jgi:hypothetical protein
MLSNSSILNSPQRIMIAWRRQGEGYTMSGMEEGRKRVLAIVAGIIVARHLDTADDFFGGPQGSPRTDKMVAAAIQWAEQIMQKIDNV